MGSKDFKQTITRRMLKKRDAAVKGYFLTNFTDFGFILPLLDIVKIQETFNGSCVGVSLPETTLKTSVYVGRAGWSREVPISSTRGHNISLTFIVGQDMLLPMYLNKWYDKLLNLYQGKIDTDKGYNTKYNTNIYGCQFWYWMFLPNMLDVIYGFHGEGIFPLKRLTTDFSNVIGSPEHLQVSLDFHVDYFREYYYGSSSNKDIFDKGESLSKKYLDYKIIKDKSRSKIDQI